MFFRRLATRKSYNVAVVAIGGRQIVIAWNMLKQKRTVSLHPAETDPRRAGQTAGQGEQNAVQDRHAKKGVKCLAQLPDGSHRIKPMAEVHQEEGLPAPAARTPADERKMPCATSTLHHFAVTLTAEHIVSPAALEEFQATWKVAQAQARARDLRRL